MKKSFLFFLPLFLYGGNLSTLVESTLKNKLIESYEFDLNSQKYNYKSLKSEYKPQISIGSTLSKTKNETVSMADNSLITYASIDYTIYDGGAKKHLYKMQDYKIEEKKSNLTSIKNQLVLDLVINYYEYFSFKSQKQAKLLEVDTLNEQKKRLLVSFKVGTVTDDEIDKINSAIANSKLELSKINLNMETTRLNMEHLTNTDVNIEKGSKIVLKEIKKELRDDLKALEYLTMVQKENVKVQKATEYPLIKLNNTFSHYKLNYKNNMYENDLETQNILSINFNWELYDFGKRKNKYHSEEQKYKQLLSHLEYQKEKVEKQLRLAKVSYEIGKIQIKTAKLAVESSEANYKKIEAQYQAGIVNNITFLGALNDKTNAISNFEIAKNNFEVAKAKLLFQSGHKIYEYIK